MTHPEGAEGRALHALTVGLLSPDRAKQIHRAKSKLDEVMMQFQFDIAGTATSSLVFASVDVVFDYPLHYAPGQRDSELDHPHFHYGSYTPGNPVGIHATVTAWNRDPATGAFIGATVGVGVIGSGAFTGRVHLSFQGYGALDWSSQEAGT